MYFSDELLNKENKINEKLFDIFLKSKECDFTRWMDKQKLCYPSNLTLCARIINNNEIVVYEGIAESYGSYMPIPWCLDSFIGLDEDRYPGVSGKCIEYLKTNKPELYEEIKEYITED